MLSGVGPADHLRAVGVPVVHDAAEVGANLQDHLDLCAIAALTGPHSYDGWDRWDRAAWAGLRWLATRRGPASASLFETGAFWTTGDAGRPDLQFHLGQGSGIEAGIDAVTHGITLNSAFLRPRSRGTVRLASADPAAAPLIDPNYWEAPEDRAASLRGLEIAREVLARPELSRFVAREALPGAGVSGADLLDYARRIAKTDHHPAGTCRMGPDAGAVVDLSLRVNGVEGLRVCDASVMPALVSSNTNAPTIAIAEKGAEILRGNR
jgi:choline dehydrogenase-like flavoprotein